MATNRPLYQNIRQFTDNHYTESGRAGYIKHVAYAASNPTHFIRPFILLQSDLKTVFEYVEPSDTNLTAYSYRIHELLVRTCIEVEANFRSILKAHEYSRVQHGKRSNIEDYYLVDYTHRLSDYSVKLPYWRESLTTAIRRPFARWAEPPDPARPWSLQWFDAYNTSKHDRSDQLQQANLEHLIDAMAGLLALLTSQYLFEDFGPSADVLALNSGPDDGFAPAIGDYFRVRLPTAFPPELRYSFDWQKLRTDPDPFERFDYDALRSSRTTHQPGNGPAQR